MVNSMNTLSLDQVEPVLAEFGKRHGAIRKLEIFGSFASGRASSQSDLDVLVTFGDEIPQDLGYFDLFTSLLQELQCLFQREVDLVDRMALRDDAFGYNAVQYLKTVYERL
jgi:predicted nucleotidyltransferase